MAHRIFRTIINALEARLVCIEKDITDYRQYFNSWKGDGSEGIDKIFRRKTKLTLRIMFWLIVSRIVRSLPSALDEFFSCLDLPAPTKSAFSMKRKLIKSDLFRYMDNIVVKEFYNSNNVRTWRGFVLIACDGSNMVLPDVEELGDRFGWYHTDKERQLYPGGRACIFQDTLNNITIRAELEPKDRDERYSYLDYWQGAVGLVGKPSIMLLDRGYFSYYIIYKMIKSGQRFVMKAREAPWRSKFLRSGLDESTVRIVPSRATSVYRCKEWIAEQDRSLSVRLVRFNHPDGSADVLITNIEASGGITSDDIIGLYGYRWPAETAYGIYKNDEAVELFSSFRADGILQDFHAAVLLFNLASILAADSVRKPGRKGRMTKPDMNIVIGLLHNICPLFTLGSEKSRLWRRLSIIEKDIGLYRIYIKSGRSYPRIRKNRKTSGKFYRQLNFTLAI